MFNKIKSLKIESLNAEFFEFEHDKTKAKHYHLKSDDVNKGFMVLFKTLPFSDSGVMHILEHCALAGSRDFDMRDPFFSILKQSLQTFMNAMTDEDNTVYPFATQNKKDFFNLMHVYTNAVFFPLLKKEVFQREGWRYEFDENENLKINGVVYNEMLGRLSSPQTRLWNAIMEVLYPDTVYAYEPGGLPNAIPDLSYEQFVEFHKKHYHPSNATFVTCGDIDFTEIHEKLEELALNEFDYQAVELEGNVVQTPFEKTVNKTLEFPYAEPDFAENNSYVKLYHLDNGFDEKNYLAASFICKLLNADASSILTKNLEESELIKNVDCSVFNNINMTYFVICVDGIEIENIEKIDQIIEDTFKSVIENGFEQSVIDKELHLEELRNLSQFNNLSNTATYLTNIITRFEASGFNKPELYLNPKAATKVLKELLEDKNHMQNFIKNNFIENNFSANLTFKASPEKIEQEAKQLEELASKKQAMLTQEDKQKIINESALLEKFMDQDDKDDLPEFSVADIPFDFNGYKTLDKIECNDTKIYACVMPTHGISYVNKSAYLQSFKASDLPYLNIYQFLFGNIGHGDKTYQQEDEYVYSICGGLGFDVKLNEDRHNPENVYLRLDLRSKMLTENNDKVKQLFNDKLTKLRFDEKEHIISTLERWNLSGKSSYFNSGHTIAASMASSKLSTTHHMINTFSNIEFDLLLNKLVQNLRTDENEYNLLINKLKEIHTKALEAFNTACLFVIDSDENIDRTIATFFDKTIVSEPNKKPITNDLTEYNADVIISAESSANYCAMLINAPYRDHELAGAYAVLSKIISTEYAHNTFREKGGAYGGWATYSGNNETFALQTYMDPGLTATFNEFKNFKQWIKNLEISDKHLTEGILQVIASFDSPTSRINQAGQAFERYFDDIKDEEVNQLRTRVIKTTKQEMQRVINELILPELDNAVFTALANKQQYKNEKLELNTISFS